MSAAARVRAALDVVGEDAAGNALDLAEGDIVALLAERDRLAADVNTLADRIAVVLAIHAPQPGYTDGPNTCAGCGLDGTEEPYEWPCATARALKAVHQ